MCACTLHKPTPSTRSLLNCPLECPGLCCLEKKTWHSQQSKVVTQESLSSLEYHTIRETTNGNGWKMASGLQAWGNEDLVTWFPGQLVAFQGCRFAIDCGSGQLTHFVPASHLPHGTWSFPGWWCFFFLPFNEKVVRKNQLRPWDQLLILCGKPQNRKCTPPIKRRMNTFYKTDFLWVHLPFLKQKNN